LKRILSWSRGQLVTESAERLIEKKPGLFFDGSEKPRVPKSGLEAIEMLSNPSLYGLDLVNSTPENLSYTIQDILDAIGKKDTMDHHFAGGLPENSVFQIGEMLKLEISEKAGSEVVDLVLKEIGK